MKYLLDTHAFLWYFEDSDKLSEKAAGIIEDSTVQKYVSIASLWEFSIKHGMGKFPFEGGLSQLCEQIKKAGFLILPITQAHLTEMMKLPFIHRDPFDRLLIGVTIADKMTILTIDENIYKYDVSYIW